MAHGKTRRTVLKGAAAAGAAGLAGCLGGDDGGSDWVPMDAEEIPPEGMGDQVNVWNWYEDWVAEVGKDFEEEYGVTVNLSDFATSGDWFSRLQSGNGEVDQVVNGMAQMDGHWDLYEPLPIDMMDSWELTDDAGKEVMEEYYTRDGDHYAVPYSRGVNPALNYNTNEFDEAPESWDVMWDEAYEDRLAVMDSYSYATTMGACYTGQNPHDPDDFEAIREALVQQKPLNRTYWNDYEQGMNMMADEEIYATGNVQARAYRARFQVGGPVGWTIPKEGTSVGTYPYTIPKNAPNPKASLAFFDYLLGQPENWVRGFTITGFTPAMKGFKEAAMEQGVSEEEVEYVDTESNSHPDATWYEPAQETSETRERLNEIWTEVKAA